VAQWFGDLCGSSFELLPLLGQLTVYSYGPGWSKLGLSWVARWAATWATHEEKEICWLGKFGPKGFRRKKSFFIVKSFYKL
jgi:hypothetical protein